MTPAIYILEDKTWLAAGLRKHFPDRQESIIHRSRARDLLELPVLTFPGLYLLDFDSSPEQAMAALRMLQDLKQSQRAVLILSREQMNLSSRFLKLDCLAYTPKATPVSQLGKLCQSLISRQLLG